MGEKMEEYELFPFSGEVSVIRFSQTTYDLLYLSIKMKIQS